MKDVDLEAALPPVEMTRRFRRWLAVLVGLAAVMAATMSWVESDAGRREDKALVDASRAGLEVFSRVAASQPRLQYEVNGARRVTVLNGLSAARVAAAPSKDLVAFRSALGLSQVDNKTARRLIRVGSATLRLPPNPKGVDPATLEAVTTKDQKQVDRVVATQKRAVDRADGFGVRQERAIFAIGLIAIAASLLGLAGLMGEGRGGRLSLWSATGALTVATVWGLSGFLP